MSAAPKRGSYPHPVLDASDDVDSDIEVFNTSFSPTVDDVELKFQVRMDDPDIQRLIDSEEARFSFRWKCGSTLASEELEPQHVATHVDSTSFVAWIPQERIRRTVKVEFKVVALGSIKDYHLARQHDDYGGASFDIAIGDVLADGGFLTFEADKLFDPLNPPIGSCFRFVEDKKVKKGLEVRFDDDEFIIVAFPEKMISGFASLGSRPDLQISLVVLPALMETIGFIKENANQDDSEDLSDRVWYQAITALISQSGALEDRTFDLAQKILGNPLDLSLTTSLSPEEDDE